MEWRWEADSSGYVGCGYSVLKTGDERTETQDSYPNGVMVFTVGFLF